MFRVSILQVKYTTLFKYKKYDIFAEFNNKTSSIYCRVLYFFVVFPFLIIDICFSVCFK